MDKDSENRVREIVREEIGNEADVRRIARELKKLQDRTKLPNIITAYKENESEVH